MKQGLYIAVISARSRFCLCNIIYHQFMNFYCHANERTTKLHCPLKSKSATSRNIAEAISIRHVMQFYDAKRMVNCRGPKKSNYILNKCIMKRLDKSWLENGHPSERREHSEFKLRSSGMISFLRFAIISNFNQNVILIPRNWRDVAITLRILGNSGEHKAIGC